MPDLAGMPSPSDLPGDSVTSENEETRRHAMEDRLKNRDAERLQSLEAKRVARAETSAEHESVQFFTREFHSDVEAILGDLAAASENRVDKTDLPTHLENVNEAIQKLTKYLADSKIFLPTYDLRKSQEKIDELNDNLARTKSRLLPKKKFGFKNKKAVVKDDSSSSPSSSGENGSKAPTQEKSSSNPEMTLKPEVADEGEHVIADRKSELLAVTEDVDNRVIGLFRLEDSDILLRGSPSAIHVRNLRRCKVFAGPVSGSIFIDKCEDCVFVLSCQQLRIHSTKETSFYIHVTSKAIVEDCSRVSFAPYNLDYVGLDNDYVTSGLDRSRNNWSQVDDFNFLATESASPNWRLLTEEERTTSWVKNVEKIMNSRRGGGEEL